MPSCPCPSVPVRTRPCLYQQVNVWHIYLSGNYHLHIKYYYYIDPGRRNAETKKKQTNKQIRDEPRLYYIIFTTILFILCKMRIVEILRKGWGGEGGWWGGNNKLHCQRLYRIRVVLIQYSSNSREQSLYYNGLLLNNFDVIYVCCVLFTRRKLSMIIRNIDISDNGIMNWIRYANRDLHSYRNPTAV